MKAFKIIIPKNQILYDLTMTKISQLFYTPESQGEFYCFKNKTSMIISNNYQHFLSWSEKQIPIPQFLSISQINGDLGKVPFPAWINNNFIMAYDNKLKQWIKIIFSHIGLTAFYSTSGIQYNIIAELDYNYLGMDLQNNDSINYADIDNYDISNIPGIGMVREFET